MKECSPAAIVGCFQSLIKSYFEEAVVFPIGVIFLPKSSNLSERNLHLLCLKDSLYFRYTLMYHSNNNSANPNDVEYNKQSSMITLEPDTCSFVDPCICCRTTFVVASIGITAVSFMIGDSGGFRVNSLSISNSGRYIPEHDSS